MINLLRLFPCWGDLWYRPTSTGMRLEVLDGIRGLAMLGVFIQHFHTNITSSNLGLFSVYLFFVLSGFLLVQPLFSGTIHHFGRWLGGYAIRRFLRIYPMYFFVVAIITYHFIIPDKHWVFMNVTFQWSDGVYWSLKQEVGFYVVFPLFFAVLYRLRRPQSLWPVLFLVLAASVYYLFLSDIFLSTTWKADDRATVFIPYCIHIFLMGMAAGCFVHTNTARYLASCRWNSILGNICCFGLVAALIWAFKHYRPYDLSEAATWQSTPVFSVLLAAFVASNVIFDRYNVVRLIISSLPMRALGIVSFSFYLLHVNSIIPDFYKDDYIMVSVARFFSVYAVSCVTYCLIERPFITLGGLLAKKIERAPVSG